MGDAASVRLDPVRAALLAQAEVEAERIVDQADERAAAQVLEAEEQKAALVARARAEGEAAADLEAVSELTRARRQARTLVLEVQRAIYDELRRDALDAAQRLRSQPRYDQLLERLAAAVRDELGSDAELELNPPDGGVIGHVGNRRVEYTLPVLVERCVAEHGDAVERLWA
jgi:vacuolar-type H+-ATPase subunit E/Vma4